MSTQTNSCEDIRRLFAVLVDPPSPLFPPGFPQSGVSVFEISFDHILTQVSAMAGLSRQQTELWRAFIKCGVQQLATLLPQDDYDGMTTHFLLLLHHLLLLLLLLLFLLILLLVTFLFLFSLYINFSSSVPSINMDELQSVVLSKGTCTFT